MTEIPARIELREGQDYMIELPSLATSGYVWDHEVTGSPGTVDVEWNRGFGAESPPAAVGVSAPEKVTIEGRQPGTVTLRLWQHRRWEQNVAPRREHRIAVVVGGTDPRTGG